MSTSEMSTKRHWKRNYFTILIGQTFSQVTSGALQMAIVFYLTLKTGSSMVLSMATMMGFLPQAVLGPFIGTLIDRHSRKKIMITSDLVIAGAAAILAFIATYRELPVWMIMLVLLIRSIGTAFHTPASGAITPMIVPEEALTKCTGYNQSMQAIGYILSPAIAGVLYAAWPLEAIIMLDVFGAVVASISVALIHIPDPKKDKSSEKANYLQDTLDGYRALRENKGLFGMVWVGTIYMFFYMPISALFPLMSISYFGGTPVHSSITEVAFAVGMLLGGFALSHWKGFKNRMTTIGISIFVMGFCMALSGLLPRGFFPMFVVFCTIMGFSAPFYGLGNVLFQEQIAPEYLGRCFSLLCSTISLAMPVGLFFSGIFAEKIGVEKWFILCGVSILFVAASTFVIPTLRTADRKYQDSLNS